MNYNEIKRRDGERKKRLQRSNGTYHVEVNKSTKKSKDKFNIKIIVLMGMTAVIIFTLIITGLFEQSIDIVSNNNSVNNELAVSHIPSTPEPTPAVTATPEPIRRGSKEPIPPEVEATMLGRSYPKDKDARISLDELSYLTIPHYDFNGQITEGHMIVAADLADEVLDIFAELFDVKYPVEKMELIDKYFDMQTEQLDSPDRSSMGRNNTSSFCYRVVAGTNNLSQHAMGRAIDLNPKVNPWVSSGGTVSPRNAGKYAQRDLYDINNISEWTESEKKAFIGRDTEVYEIFRKYGWQWGGEIWSNKDYQHFEKPR